MRSFWHWHKEPEVGSSERIPKATSSRWFWHWRKEPSVGSSGSGSKAKPPKKVFPSGIKLLYKSEPDNAVVDIIFIHGLTGDREQTCKADDVENPWPQDVLPTEISNARILTFGYDAYVANWKHVVSNNRISNHSMNLLTSIATYKEKDDTNNRPIIFVCHSLGGLVCEDALVLSQKNPEPHLEIILECTRGIIFLGTPHQGSELASYGVSLSRAIGLLKHTNSKIVQVLKGDSEVLSLIINRFRGMIMYRQDQGKKQIEITCFYEELPLPVIGMIVPQHSATIPGYTRISIHENHMGMTKFGSAEHPGFEAVAGELRRWIKALPKTTAMEQQSVTPEPKKAFIVPYTSNPSFVGRSDILTKLKKHFDPDRILEDETGVQVRAALFALGGTGKSQIALAYAYQVHIENKDLAVIWVHASNMKRFRESYYQIARSCQIPGCDDPNVDVLKLVKAWLENTHLQHWLMVIDNADDTEMFLSTNTAITTLGSSSEVASDGDLSQYIPNCSHGSILVTTRNKNIGSKLTNDGEIFEVENMTQWDCIELIRKQLQDETIEVQDMAQLATRLENLPLTIVQATTFIQENKMTIGEYIELLDQNDSNLVELLRQPLEAEGGTHRMEENSSAISCERLAITEVPDLGSLSKIQPMFSVLSHECDANTRDVMTEEKLRILSLYRCIVKDSGK